MGLTAPNWTEIQNLHLQSLGAKMTGNRWTSTLIRKLWDMIWDVWNHWNQNLQPTNVPMKFEILRLIDKRVYHHIKKAAHAVLFEANLSFILSTTLYSPDLYTNASHG